MKKKLLSLLNANRDIMLFLLIMCISQAVFLYWYLPQNIDEKLNEIVPFRNRIEKIHAMIYAKATYYTAKVFPAYRDIQVVSTWKKGDMQYENAITYPANSHFPFFYITLPCNGYKVYWQFLCVILFYFGPWKKKLWYIPAGILILAIINGIRLITLYFVGRELPGFYDFYHVEGSRYIMYPLIFILFMIWERKINRPYQQEKKVKKLEVKLI